MERAKLYWDYFYVGAVASAFKGENCVDCQFNPTELEVSHNAVWHAPLTVPFRDNPVTEYQGGGAGNYHMSLFFDAYAEGGERRDIRKDINNLMALTLRLGGYTVPLPYPYLGEPPTVIFIWGGVRMFRAVLTDLTVKYTMFDENGVPTRATADCKFMQQSHPLDILPAQNPTSRTESRHTVRVTQGDRLDLIANNYYGDSRMWRAIADDNDLDDPFNLTPGQLLSMPNPK